MKALKSNGVLIVILGVVCYAVTTVLLLHSSHVFDESRHVRSNGAAAETSGASWEFTNPEIDQLIAELKKERESLGAREQQLNELAVRLQTERSEIGQVTQAVHQLQMEFDKNIVRVKDEETANLKKLAKTYAAMTPEGAAAILAELDDETIVKVFAFMKEAESAPILEGMSKLGKTETKRAANISERLRLAIFRSPTPKS